jgi:hypothetical protein
MLEAIQLQDYVRTQPRLKKLLNNKTFFTTERTSQEIFSLFCWVNNHLEGYYLCERELEQKRLECGKLTAEKEALQEKYNNLKTKLKELLKD